MRHTVRWPEDADPSCDRGHGNRPGCADRPECDTHLRPLPPDTGGGTEAARPDAPPAPTRHPGAARSGRHPRGARARRTALARRRLRRCRRLLRHLRLRHHLRPAAGGRAERFRVLAAVLRRTRVAHPPGGVPGLRLHPGRLPALRLEDPLRGVPARRAGGRPVRHERGPGGLGDRLPPGGRRALAVPALVVTVRGGAVLPAVARAPPGDLEGGAAPVAEGAAAGRALSRVVRPERADDRRLAVLGVLRPAHPAVGAGRRWPAGPVCRGAGPAAACRRRGRVVARAVRDPRVGPGVRRRHTVPRPRRRPARPRRPAGDRGRLPAVSVRCLTAARAASRDLGGRRLVRLVPVALAAAGARPRRAEPHGHTPPVPPSERGGAAAGLGVAASGGESGALSHVAAGQARGGAGARPRSDLRRRVLLPGRGVLPADDQLRGALPGAGREPRGGARSR